MGVVGAWVRQSADTVVAVTKQFDAQTGVVCCQFVEAREQLVQHSNQLLRRALRTESREATDVSEQYTTHRAEHERLWGRTVLPFRFWVFDDPSSVVVKDLRLKDKDKDKDEDLKTGPRGSSRTRTCRHTDTPDRVKPLFVSFDNRHSDAQPRAPDVKSYKWRLNPVWHRMLYSCNHMETVGVKGLSASWGDAFGISYREN